MDPSVLYPAPAAGIALHQGYEFHGALPCTGCLKDNAEKVARPLSWERRSQNAFAYGSNIPVGKGMLVGVAMLLGVANVVNFRKHPAPCVDPTRRPGAFWVLCSRIHGSAGHRHLDLAILDLQSPLQAHKLLRGHRTHDTCPKARQIEAPQLPRLVPPPGLGAQQRKMLVSRSRLGLAL